MPSASSQKGGEGRKKILFLSHTLPYPPDGGVWIRTYNILRQLSKAFDVTVLSFERLGTASQEVDPAASTDRMRSFVDFELFRILQNRSRLAYLLNHLRSFVFRQVYTRYVYRSAAYRRRLRQLITTEHFDLIHVDSLDLSDYLGGLGSIPIVCNHHNVESELLRRRSALEGTVFSTSYMRLQASLMEKEEKRWCPRVALNVLCSGVDLKTLRSMVPDIRTAIVPNGVDVEEFQPIPCETSGAIFVGAATWFPNLDALVFFTEQILPLIRRELPEYPVRWVGAAPKELRTAFAESGVDILGYVQDVRPHVSAANTFVVPLRAGSGTRLKILMAWSMARPVVSTSVGCEGLNAKDGVNILIRDDPADFARAVIALERDTDLRQRLAKAGRETAATVYDWPVIGRDMVALYERVIAAGDDTVSVE